MEEERLLALEKEVEDLTLLIENLKKRVMEKSGEVSQNLPPMQSLESVIEVTGVGHSGELMREIQAPSIILAERKMDIESSQIVQSHESSQRIVLAPTNPINEFERVRRINKIRAALPLQSIANPIAALINFCRHQLKFNVSFVVDELPSSNPSEPDYHVTVMFPEQEKISEFTDSRKKHAKERAAKLALKRLNEDDALLSRCIDFSFVLK
jgi:hypothetical protein